MSTPSDRLIAALELFSSKVDSTREEGFSRLVARSRPFLNSLLANSLRSESDREDIIQQIFQRVWKSRERFEFTTVGAWWRFLRTMTRNCLIDHVRSQSETASLEDLELQDIPPAEIEMVDAVVEAMEDRRLLYRLADELFLDLPQGISDSLRTHHLLAAKLFLIDRMPWQTVCRIMNSQTNEFELMGRSDLDRIVSDPSLIRHLAFTELHWENEQLCAYLLEIGSDPGKDSLGLENPWSEEQKEAIQLRFQYALLLDQILSRLGTSVNKSELVAIFDRCVQLFPFVEIMYRLRQNVGPVKGGLDQLASPGLWHRMVFQYHCHNALPQKDILDRTAGAAQAAGTDVTPGKLNVGLSNGRLFKKLADYYLQRGSDGY